jgi:hypothetical protein
MADLEHLRWARLRDRSTAMVGVRSRQIAGPVMARYAQAVVSNFLPPALWDAAELAERPLKTSLRTHGVLVGPPTRAVLKG